MTTYQQPDAQGHFGPYGGNFVSETLTYAISELQQAYEATQNDPSFGAEFAYELAHFVGRPSPIYHAERLSRELGGAQIYLKREDLNHTGAHKINNVIGQAMLARRMGKPRVIAEPPKSRISCRQASLGSKARELANWDIGGTSIFKAESAIISRVAGEIR